LTSKTESQLIPIDQIKAVLFDLDGTLLDTDHQAVDRLAERLRPYLGRRASPTARWLIMKAETPGNALITMLDFFHLDEPLMAFTDKLRQRRGIYPAHQFQLIPNVEEMILELNATGYLLGIVTTRSRYHIERFLERFPRISRAIKATCGLQDTRRLKPHPAPVKLAAQRLGVAAEQCLMVGDTTVDVRSARRAGSWSAAVLCGFGELGELKKAGAHVILSSTADLGLLLRPPS
jgi:HAD superfamily hydrolase (TIGR01662 family)